MRYCPSVKKTHKILSCNGQQFFLQQRNLCKTFVSDNFSTCKLWLKHTRARLSLHGMECPVASIFLGVLDSSDPEDQWLIRWLGQPNPA